MTKNTLGCFALVAAAVTTVELHGNLSAPSHPNTSRAQHADYVLTPIPESAVHHRQTGSPHVRLWDSTSGNWSGYAVPLDTSGQTDTFSHVAGTWTVPTVTGNRKSTGYASTWVGLDGYNDGTVEQIGTEQDWTGRSQQNYAWFEMYPGGSYQITGFPVNPGDSITAAVTYEGSGVFQLTLVNTTRKVSFAVPTSYTTSATAARSSAEWVTEAPSTATRRGALEILPLANFGTVNFSGCEAIGGSGVLDPISAWSADPLTMVDPSGGGAVPSSLTSGGTAFSVKWN